MFGREQILHIQSSLPWRRHFKPVENRMFWLRSQARRNRWIRRRETKRRRLAQRRLPLARRLKIYQRTFSRSLCRLRKKAYLRSEAESAKISAKLIQVAAVFFVLCLGLFLSPPDWSEKRSELAKIQKKAPFVASQSAGIDPNNGSDDWNGHLLQINPYAIPPATPDQIVYDTSPLPPLEPISQGQELLHPTDIEFVQIN